MSRASQLREMAATLLALADEDDRARGNEVAHIEEGGATLTPHLRAVASDTVYLGRLAQAMIRLRRLREQHLDAELFAEPGWEMLLDLYVQRVAGRMTSVTSLCTASCAPMPTALRWLDIIQKQGLVSREDDPSDKRRSFISLSRSGETAVTNYLSESARYVRLSNPVPFMLIEEVGT